MKIIAIIPARLDSKRLPGKPLANICGIPMVEHVRKRAKISKYFNDVIVATCDEEIYNCINNNGGHAVMTSKNHKRCTDRIAEAAKLIDADIIVNVQGDEPLLNPNMFEPVIEPLLIDNNLDCVNLMSLANDIDYNNNGVVKVTVDNKFNALYFSREPIPNNNYSPSKIVKKYKQLGIIAFRKNFLIEFSKLEPTPLEIAESVDMLRALEYGYKVKMVLTSFNSIGVDTKSDLEKATEMMELDKFFPYE